MPILLGPGQSTVITLTGPDARLWAGAMWIVDDPDVASVTPAADGLSCRVEHRGTGRTIVSAAGPGPSLNFAVHSIGGPAEAVGFTVSPPRST